MDVFALLVVTGYGAVTLWLVRPDAATGPLVALLLEPRSPLAGQGGWSVLFGASVLLLVLATTRLHPVRRDHWRDLPLSLIVAVPLLLGNDLLAGVPTLPLTLVLALLISLPLMTQLQLDARIRRTLSLEGQA